MHKQSKTTASALGNKKVSEFKSMLAGQYRAETKSERVDRLSRQPGGLILGWMFDEARKRAMPLNEMAAVLGVTYGYINQLMNSVRKTEDRSHDFCVKVARWLGVPTISVKIVAGVVRLSDFLQPAESEESAIERAIDHIQGDPIIRQAVRNDGRV